MKIWNQYGSEHSANLVMIGRFTDAKNARKANAVIDELSKQVAEDQATGAIGIGRHEERYSDDMLDLLSRLNVGMIGPQELEQFLYDVNVKVKDSEIVITTDEVDISAFLKIMFINGARIEVFSSIDFPDTQNAEVND